MKQDRLTQERLKELLSYDSNTGVFTWKVGGSKMNMMRGKTTGTMHSLGYININIEVREATLSENQQNRKKNINNKSGYVGVSYNKKASKPFAQIRLKVKLC